MQQNFLQRMWCKHMLLLILLLNRLISSFALKSTQKWKETENDNLETLVPGRGRGCDGEGVVGPGQDSVPNRLEGDDAAAEGEGQWHRPLRPPVQHGQDGSQDPEASQVVGQCCQILFHVRIWLCSLCIVDHILGWAAAWVIVSLHILSDCGGGRVLSSSPCRVPFCNISKIPKYISYPAK